MKRSRPEPSMLDVGGPSNHQEALSTSIQQAGSDATDDFPVLKTRMSPKLLLQFINSGLSDNQISDIQDMGFGGILCLKTDMLQGQLAYWLVSRFDPFTSSLLNGQLPIRDEDVHLATGLPMGEIAISQATRFEQTEEFLELVNEWKSQYEGVDKVTNSHVLSKMAEQRQGGADFKRNFIVFIVAALLMGVKGNVPSIRILKCLRDVSLIPHMNWCDFTRRNLIASVQHWWADKEKEDNGGCKKIFRGPILVLILIYLDRSVFKARTVDRVFPTLCTWTKDAISFCISKEKKEARRFGSGFIDNQLVKHPGCFGSGFRERSTRPQPDVVMEQEVVENENDAPNNNEPDNHDDNVTRVSNCIVRMATMAKALAAAFHNFADAINSAKLVMPDSIVVGQLSAMADSLLGGFQLTPPVIPEAGVGANADRGKVDPTVCPDIAKNSDEPGTAKNPDVHPTVHVAHETAATVGRSKSNNHGVRATSSAEGVNDDPCWNDPAFVAAAIALSNAFNEPVAPKRRRVAPECPTFNLFQSQDISNSYGSQGPPIKPVASPQTEATHGFPLNASKSVHNVAKPDNKRDIIVLQIFKSPYVQRNISMLAELSQSEKDFSDLVFRDGSNESEILFRNNRFQLRRCDFKTFIANTKIAANVINVWASILNKREEIRAASSPLRLYAFVTHNMMFAFTLREPLLICVNFVARKIEVIHPMQPKSVDFAEYVLMVRDFIRSVLVSRSSIFKTVQFFKCEEFVPKSHALDIVDDGIYLMCYMEIYTGCRHMLKTQVINVRPAAAVGKILFRQKLKYCFALLSSAQNDLSQQVSIDARCLNVRTGKQAVEQQVVFSDSHLLDYVFLPSKGDAAKYDAVVVTNFGEVTKEGMSSLRPRKWVADMVIDMFGIYSTLPKPELLYIPTTARHLNPKRDRTLGRNYIKTSYMPNDGTCVKAMFIAIIEDSHWFLIVCDMEEKTNYILNSLRTKDIRPDTEIAADVVSNVTTILCRSKEYKLFVGVPLFPFETLNVPQQTNIHDCGVYVLKWLEAGRDRSLWKAASNFKGLPSFRRAVALSLLRWQENQREMF